MTKYVLESARKFTAALLGSRQWAEDDRDELLAINASVERPLAAYRSPDDRAANPAVVIADVRAADRLLERIELVRDRAPIIETD